MKVFKMVIESAAVVPDAVWNRVETLVVAKSEQDARDSYNPAITGCCGSMHRVLSCEFIGDVSHVVDDQHKMFWDQDDGN